jgi:hypothetical protein
MQLRSCYLLTIRRAETHTGEYNYDASLRGLIYLS